MLDVLTPRTADPGGEWDVVAAGVGLCRRHLGARTIGRMRDWEIPLPRGAAHSPRQRLPTRDRPGRRRPDAEAAKRRSGAGSPAHSKFYAELGAAWDRGALCRGTGVSPP